MIKAFLAGPRASQGGGGSVVINKNPNTLHARSIHNIALVQLSVFLVEEK